MKPRLAFLSILVLVLATNLVFAQVENYDHIISNSEDWRDVYSIILYGKFVGKPTDFLVSTRHATLILNSIKNNAFANEAKQEFVSRYEALVRELGKVE